MKKDGGWKTKESEYLYQSKWYDLRQDLVSLPSGDEVTYTYLEHPGYVVVVPLFDDGDVLVENIYRYALRETLVEFPSGGIDGEAPLVAAARELSEETGWIAGNFKLLGKYSGSSGISDEEYYIFLGTNLENRLDINREPTEQIQLERMPLRDLCRGS